MGELGHGELPSVIALAGGTFTAGLTLKGPDAIISSTGIYHGVSRTVRITGRLHRGRFVARSWH